MKATHLIHHNVASKTGAALALVLALFPASAVLGGGSEITAVGTSSIPCPPKKGSHTVVVPWHRDGGVEVNAAVRALDRLRDKVEEWGVVTISAPIACFTPNAFFVEDDIVSPRELYKESRDDIQGTAAISTSRAIANSLAATATPTVTPSVNVAAGGAAAAPAAPAAADAGGPQSPATEIKIDGQPGLTAPFANLLSKTLPRKSVGASLRDAQDNTIRQKIYSQMSHPRGIDTYSTVIFAIVQVSCNPGWRTKENYIADCSASLEYYDMCQRTPLTRAAQRQPTVFSVLPLMDAQTIEMANSQRDVTQLAFDLAGSAATSGVDIKARDLFKFVKQYSRDLRSVAPIPVVNSYSSGSTFGFRFSPSFQALADPAQKKARAANVLLPTTFPALITVVIYDVDVKAAENTFDWDRKEGATAPGPDLIHDLAIMTHVSTRWNLKDRPPLWQFPKRLFTPMKRDTASIEVGAADDVATVYAAKTAYKTADESHPSNRVGPNLFNPVYEEVRREILDLESKGLGRSWPIPLPENIREVLKKAKDQGKADDVARLQRLQKDLDTLRGRVDPLPSQIPATGEAEKPAGTGSVTPAGEPGLAGGFGLFQGEPVDFSPERWLPEGTEPPQPPQKEAALPSAKNTGKAKAKFKPAVTAANAVVADLPPNLPEK